MAAGLDLVALRLFIDHVHGNLRSISGCLEQLC